MNESYFVNKSFERTDFTEAPIIKGEYEECNFLHCNFFNTDFSSCRFIDCRFTDCNLSTAKLDKTVLRDVAFVNCKMLGLRFDSCDPFGLSFSFDHCQLNHSSFYGTKIKKTVFNNSQLKEVDFTDCDLSGAVFDNCDFAKALFENTVLETADFRKAYNYSINPQANGIKKAKFAIDGLPGLLDHLDIVIEQ